MAIRVVVQIRFIILFKNYSNTVVPSIHILTPLRIMPTSQTDQKQRWSKETLERYEPIKELGRGGFASVILAKRKDICTGKTKGHNLVAVKQANAKTNVQSNYAGREVFILREISHPNIMKLIEYWEQKNSTDSEPSVTMILSYGGDKTLEYLLKKTGAPSLTFSRAIISQLVDAVAYLHSHAIIHRDIKPDNVVIKGINLADDSIFDDDSCSNIPWGDLRKKWHLTLVDFGFARALAPSDLNMGSRNQEVKSFSNTSSINDIMIQKSGKEKKHKKKPDRSNLDSRNISHHNVLNLSALGNRFYAAPEVKNNVRENKKFITPKQRQLDVTLSRFVSNYGMIADAFSVGATARYIFTGVRPEDSVDEFIASYYSPINKLIRSIKKKSRKKSTTKKRKKTYRSGSDIPNDALTLIRSMTNPNMEDRTSVRDARLTQYIDEVLDDHYFQKHISFLKNL